MPQYNEVGKPYSARKAMASVPPKPPQFDPKGEGYVKAAAWTVGLMACFLMGLAALMWWSEKAKAESPIPPTPQCYANAGVNQLSRVPTSSCTTTVTVYEDEYVRLYIVEKKGGGLSTAIFPKGSGTRSTSTKSTPNQ